MPAAIYPVAVHAWTYLGGRDDFEVVVTSLDTEFRAEVGRALVDASDAPGASPSQASAHLEDRHFEMWADARATHIDRTRSHIENQLSSLATTHQARVQLLEDQIATASHENIRRMRESELRSVEEDFDARAGRLRKSIERSDITATLLCSGYIAVIND